MCVGAARLFALWFKFDSGIYDPTEIAEDELMDGRIYLLFLGGLPDPTDNRVSR